MNGASIHPFHLRTRGLADATRWLADETHHYLSFGAPGVPALGRRVASGHDVPCLRLVELDGDATTTNDFEPYGKRFSKSAILQVSFGATEIAVIRRFSIDDATEIAGPIVPGGYEVPGTEVGLDDKGCEISDRRGGEIAIRSRYLFCGYWRNLALTASVMSACMDGRRIFRTGDRGMIERDGCLIHLGRRDSMVKIAGHAVEVPFCGNPG